MALHHNPRIVSDGLVAAYDAADINSYPGSGTTWYDLSGNGYHMTLNSAATWVSQGPGSHMNFENGIAKYLPGGVLTNIPNANGAGTICIYSTIKAPDGDWKTLIRANGVGPNPGDDHQVIISQEDGISLGMYDNNGGGFIDTGFNMNSITNYTSAFHFYAWKLLNASPFYQFFYDGNLSSSSGTLTNSNATFTQGFASIGAYHNSSNSSTSFSQEWGKIALFLYYDRLLSESELRQNYLAQKSRFGL